MSIWGVCESLGVEPSDSHAARVRVRLLARYIGQCGERAWMSLTRWEFAGESYGQDQDIWSPDLL